MIGRGVFHNPYAFLHEKKEPTKDELLSLLHTHLDLFDYYSEHLEPRKFDPLKRFFKVYIHSFPGASELREKLMHTKSTDEVRQILTQAQSDEAVITSYSIHYTKLYECLMVRLLGS